MLTIGLFGTCGGSKWRDGFIDQYEAAGIDFFNPQKDDWKPEDAINEANHLANDKIILFPITSETYATGSLSEVGFSILNAIKLDDRRDFIILIEQNLDDSLTDQTARKESLRARVLVMEHLKKLRLSNVYLVNTLQEMLTVSLSLYEAAKIKVQFEKYNPHRNVV